MLHRRAFQDQPRLAKIALLRARQGSPVILKISDKVTLGAQAGIGKSIKKPGSILLGSPAFEIMDYKRSYAVFKNLPDMAHRINDLEKKVLNLPPSEK